MISLYDILESSNGQLFGEPAAHLFTDFCFDPRHAGESQIFVALKTERGDTHQFMREAVERGVTGILCTHPPDFDTEELSVVLVRDTEAALMNWTRYMLHKLGAQVICVSGTAGKSLAVEAISRVLSTQYKVLHSVDMDLPGRLVLPATLAHLTPDHQFVVLELDVTRPGMMSEIVQVVQPDVVVLPNLGTAVGDSFASLDEIIAENRLLLDRLSPTSLAVLNADDESANGLRESTRARLLTFGVESFGADVIAYNVLNGVDKTGFDLRYGTERHVGRWIPWLGRHQIGVALAGLCVGLHYDVSLDDGLRALIDLPYLPGRMNPLNGLENSLLVDDTHAATPQSMMAALDWLEAASPQFSPDGNQRVIFVMGDMDHLGSQVGHSNRMIGQRAAQVADILITEGTEAALAGRAALDSSMNPRNVTMTYSIQDAVQAIRERYAITSNDIVLVTGGKTARMELVVSALLQNESDQGLLTRQDALNETAVLAQPSQLNWVSLDLDALATNVRGMKRVVGDSVTLMAVVKADAYGHGAVAVARTALLNGAEYLAVSSVNEALELREAGLDSPILVLNYTSLSAIRQAIRQRLTITVYDLDMARAFDRAARELGERLLVHVKIDTGMGRLGVMPKDAMNLFRHILNLKALEVEGVYTHFSSADEEPQYTALQLKTFKDLLKPLRASGFSFRYTHAANSAATLSTTESHFNMVRVGLAIYGLTPSPTVLLPSEFRPVLSWRTVVAQVKTLPPNHPVGYGRTYYTSGEERIAILPVGYADGFRRAPNTWREVLVHGQRAPVVGRVSMEKTAINVTNITGVSVGDEVVLLGRQGSEQIPAEEIAQHLGTINYEVVTTILPRSPRH
ncbi:MAG: alanine racemase [Anaerolineae bacterium]|nr:alanine racemase [Anaerolineae bacterium]